MKIIYWFDCCFKLYSRKFHSYDVGHHYVVRKPGGGKTHDYPQVLPDLSTFDWRRSQHECDLNSPWTALVRDSWVRFDSRLVFQSLKPVAVESYMLNAKSLRQHSFSPKIKSLSELLSVLVYILLEVNKRKVFISSQMKKWRSLEIATQAQAPTPWDVIFVPLADTFLTEAFNKHSEASSTMSVCLIFTSVFP